MTEVAEITWDQHQEWESEWWGDCTNTYGEETKQLTYAHRMGLTITPVWGKWPVYDLAGKSVLDLGGGPVSMLLKTINGVHLTVVDPCTYPLWVRDRYDTLAIEYVKVPAEELSLEELSLAGPSYDEVWIYNVLQHVQDPLLVLETAQNNAPLLRIFEWVDIPPCMGHPHELKAEKLNEFLGAYGTVEQMNENGCVGTAYYGTFAL